jgi:hypothetical protein
MYCLYSSGSAVTLAKARYARTGPHELIAHHTPLTDLNGAIALGLSWQEWTVSGIIADPTSVLWHDIVQISLDNTSWRACKVQSIDFPENNPNQSRYELRLLVSPLLEGATVRFPTGATNYIWGLDHIHDVSQAGNMGAPVELHYLSPLYYFPLLQDIQDFAGRGLTFTRAIAKTHGGVSYGINSPIFDNGLYIGDDTSQDTPTWTPAVSTLKSIACQLKQTRYPSNWVIGAGAGTANLLTANQSNAETDTTGMSGGYGTMSRNTSTPIAGTGDFKLIVTSVGPGYIRATSGTYATVVPGQRYCFQALVNTSGCAGGRTIMVGIAWYKVDGETMVSEDWTTPVAVPTTATRLHLTTLAPALGVLARIYVMFGNDAAENEIFYADSLMLEAIPPVLTVWTAALNKLTIDTVNNLLKWTDDTTTVSATFPTALYMAGTVVDAMVIDGTSHAVTVIAHAAAGTWYTGTGTLAAIAYPELTLGNLNGSIANLIEYPYALATAEYQAPNYSLLPLLFNTLYIANNRAEEIIKQTDDTLETATGTDISGNLAGADILITSTAQTITMSQGLAARWYLNVKRTDV